ncbi:MAG: hypothetical protein JO159_08285 [Acidobacteria bacterium]|nr:hypothetical protein [Acidobacteriota bacterium]
MATPAVNSRLESIIAAYGICWQMSLQVEQISGAQRLVGLEVELIGFHASDAGHLNPSCPMCHHVKSVLLDLAGLMTNDDVDGNALSYDLDSHLNSIFCLPALGNRAAVSVSITISWSGTADQAFETDLQSKIKAFMDRYSIHQR